MLYYLFEYLEDCCNVPGAGMFEYVTFRALFAIIVSLFVSIWFGKVFIKFLKKQIKNLPLRAGLLSVL